MKKTTSFHLEEDILKEIDDYKEKYKLSSRNVALERMLLERRVILNFNMTKVEEEKICKENKIEIKEDVIKKSIDSNFDDMKP